MKLVILTDCSKEAIDDLYKLAGTRESVRRVFTDHMPETAELAYLLFEIELFKSSSNDILLVKFSGRESVFKYIGEERPEMIVYMSYNKNSRYFIEKPSDMFLELISIFEKETINGITTKEGTT